MTGLCPLMGLAASLAAAGRPFSWALAALGLLVVAASVEIACTLRAVPRGEGDAGASRPPAGRRVEVIAHRGFSGKAPENTLAAFRAAIESGADRVEFDVQLTADGEAVVIHDATLDRTAGAPGPVAARTLAEVRALDAGAWFGPEFRGERIPTLDEALDVCRGRIAVNVEIKGESVAPSPSRAASGIEARVVDAIRRREMAGSAVVSSFEPLALERVRALAPEVVREALYDKEHQAGLTPTAVCARAGAKAFNCSAKEVTAAWIEEAHRAGLAVKVYTVDEPLEMERMVSLGVDGIFTNRPDLLLAVLGGAAPERPGSPPSGGGQDMRRPPPAARPAGKDRGDP